MTRPLPETQLDAWDDLQQTVANKRARVLRVIRGFGTGATFHEIATFLGVPINRVTGRVRELVQAGTVEDSGERRINPNSGKKNIVWVQKT